MSGIKPSVDITPHPRILQVLGEIEFKPWQCIAELVDNSVDQFLKMDKLGVPLQDPTVLVAFGRDTVVVKDNGQGMSIDALELAVKAGWTSNEKFGTLGLYGIGFNIATARLGNVTTIWTTQKGDNTWYGLELDLPQIAKGGTYVLEVKMRTKSDVNICGTEVEVSKVRPEWRDLLSNSNWVKNNVTERLASIYSTMLRDRDPLPIKFSLNINDRKVSAWQHCVWPSELTVYRKTEGIVRPIQEIDITFGVRYLLRSTGEIFETKDGLDIEDVLEIPERVYGWLGIQRYAHDKEYGVDILRNGRKIEVLCKDVFSWEDEDGDSEFEYPLDDPRHRGRIVGEIHLDHGYVHYTKHRFEREHSSWKQLLKAVKNNEPLTKREASGFSGVNTSPLGLLFRTFRRNAPQSGQKWKDYLAINDNEKAIVWAKKYRKNETPYNSDEFWKRELEKPDETPPPSGPSVTPAGTPGIILGPGGTSPSPDGGETPPDAPSTGVIVTTIPPAPPRREILPHFNYRVTGIGTSGVTYEIETFSVEPSTDGGLLPPWRSRATTRGVFEIEVNLRHDVFKFTSLAPGDIVLAEIAHLISSEESQRGGPDGAVSFGEALLSLRAKHGDNDSLDNGKLRAGAEEIRKRLTLALARNLNDEQRRALVLELPKGEAERVELAHAQGPEDMMVTDYLDLSHIISVLKIKPEVFFSGGSFSKPWTPERISDKPNLLQDYRARLIRDIEKLISIICDFINPLAPETARSERVLVRACINRLFEYLAIAY